MLQALSAAYPVRLVCAVWELAPSTYYDEPQERDDLALLSLIEYDGHSEP
jgi:hypothetical protein